jgi:hypothetical protein
MQPERETVIAPGGERPAKAARRRGERRARTSRNGPAEQPIDRIRQLVAAMKAEQDGSAPPLARDPAERVKVMGWLRRILEARKQERQGWEEQIKALEDRFAIAENAARAAMDTAEQTEAQHQRLVADLKLMHEHQRSIWALERRRLEITIEGLQRDRRNRLIARAARLARPTVAAGLLLVSVAALALAADSARRTGPMLLDRNDLVPDAVLVLK